MVLQSVKYSKDKSYLRQRKIKARRSKMGYGLKNEAIIYRTNNHISVSVFNHTENRTLLCVSSESFRRQMKKKGEDLTKTECAKMVGKKLYDVCEKNKINCIVFNVAEFRYLGSVKALIDSFNSCKKI